MNHWEAKIPGAQPITITAKTWFAARHVAAVHFKAEPGQVQVRKYQPRLASVTVPLKPGTKLSAIAFDERKRTDENAREALDRLRSPGRLRGDASSKRARRSGPGKRPRNDRS